jgi:hypothetical protein
MDVDLSTNLDALLPLSTPLYAGQADIGVGSRLMHGAVVSRQWKRDALPRGYNALIQALFENRFSDAQSGSKSLTRASARALLPAVEDDAWFFDTELLLLAEAPGYRIHEVPVGWVEDLGQPGRPDTDSAGGPSRTSAAPHPPAPVATRHRGGRGERPGGAGLKDGMGAPSVAQTTVAERLWRGVGGTRRRAAQVVS